MIFFNTFLKYENLVHGIMEKKDGLGEEALARAVRKAGFERPGIRYLVFADQVHGKNVHFCSSSDFGRTIPRTDGLISILPGQVLVVKTADCIPLLVFDPVEEIAGAVHCGRKGLEKGIIEEALRVLQKHKSRAENLIVGLGPHIRKCCYYIRATGQPYNLTGLARQKLAKSGVREKNIEDCGVCTFCDPERKFYSARRREQENKENTAAPCFTIFIGLLSKRL